MTGLGTEKPEGGGDSDVDGDRGVGGSIGGDRHETGIDPGPSPRSGVGRHECAGVGEGGLGDAMVLGIEGESDGITNGGGDR